MQLLRPEKSMRPAWCGWRTCNSGTCHWNRSTGSHAVPVLEAGAERYGLPGRKDGPFRNMYRSSIEATSMKAFRRRQHSPRPRPWGAQGFCQ